VPALHEPATASAVRPRLEHPAHSQAVGRGIRDLTARTAGARRPAGTGQLRSTRRGQSTCRELASPRPAGAAGRPNMRSSREYAQLTSDHWHPVDPVHRRVGARRPRARLITDGDLESGRPLRTAAGRGGPGGDQRHRGGARAVTSGTISSPRRSSWAFGNSARRPGSRSDSSVWQRTMLPGRAAARPAPRTSANPIAEPARLGVAGGLAGRLGCRLGSSRRRARRRRADRCAVGNPPAGQYPQATRPMRTPAGDQGHKRSSYDPSKIGTCSRGAGYDW